MNCKHFLGFSAMAVLFIAGCNQKPVAWQPSPDGRLNREGAYLNPAGSFTPLNSKVTTLAKSVDEKWVLAVSNDAISTFESNSGKLSQTLKLPSGSGLTGLLVTRNEVLISTSGETITRIAFTEGKLGQVNSIVLPKAKVGGPAYPAGLAINEAGTVLYVCLNRGNEVVEIDLAESKVTRRFPVAIAPYFIALDQKRNRLTVLCWSREPFPGEPVSPSSGTNVPVKPFGGAISGQLNEIDLTSGKVVSKVDTTLQPTDWVRVSEDSAYLSSGNGGTLTPFKLENNEWAAKKPIATFGIDINDLELSKDRKSIFAALGANSLILMFDLKSQKFVGKIPTPDYATGVVIAGGNLFASTAKGLGPTAPVKNSRQFSGGVSVMAAPTVSQLKRYGKWDEKAKVVAQEKTLPFEKNGKSPIEHVIYIIKENRTYDQIFGELPQGDGDPKLTLYGRKITPNHHALAEEFVLLDNYYCNGVLSADGHSWATEGNTTAYLERAFGGWTRSYPFGDDPIAISNTGFLWDPLLESGLTFRNFGEFYYTDPVPASATYKEIYDDFVNQTGKITFTQKIGVANVAKHTEPGSIGWNMRIPDIMRAKVFLDAFEKMEANGKMPNLTVIFLPQDHTSGATKGEPTPESCLADNDLALGQIVERVSKSKFWGKTVIFINEDDPQAGTDHVDGHRSLCLVVSPYSKRGQVISQFYNQNSVLKTILRIFGKKPLHQRMEWAPLMAECFTNTPNLTPYKLRPNNVPLDLLNGVENTPKELLAMSEKLKLAKPDQNDEDLLNRILWHSKNGMKRRYPSELAGPHGRGLAERGLHFDDGIRMIED